MVKKLRHDQNVSTLEMTITRPNWTRTLKMKVWDDRKGDRAFIRLMEPAKEAGTTFLRQKTNLWNYLPKVEKEIKIPPSMMLQPWMGSDFTNDDLMKGSSYVDDYTHAQIGEEMKDGLKILQIELTPKSDAPVVWGKVIFWIREKDNLPVQQNFLDEKGKLIKELHFSEFKTMDGEVMPSVWEVVPVLKEGQKTQLKINSVDFDPSPAIPDSVFEMQNLRK